MNGSGDAVDVEVMSEGTPPEPPAVEARVSVGRPRVEPGPSDQREVVFDISDLSVRYGSFRAVRDVSLSVFHNQITALIGPSGCGKTTVLRCLNRMNDLIEGARVEGSVRYHGADLYDPQVD